MNSTNDIFQGLSILLLSEDDGRGKALAKALRDQRARVGETNISKRESARGVDLAVVDARSERALASQLAELRADVRGRWASMVTVDFTQLVMGDGSVLLSGLVDRVAPLVEADRALSARARSETSFKTTLAPLGPPRTLRALSLSGHTLAVELRAPTLEATIEVSNELLVSAAATRGDKRWEAWSALVRILGLSDCEITVTRRAFTSFMNIMEPVDQALEVAAQERACSIHQIEREESEAQARANGGAKPKTAGIPAPPPPTPAAAWTSPAGPISPPKPPPPARPAGSLGPQRTLMGIMPGLPSPGIAANDVRALAPKAPPPEIPRYAHRAGGQSTAPKASMTLMGVAPSSIPGLAEQLRKPAVEPTTVEGARMAQREALKHALDEEFDPPTVRHNSLPDLTAELPELAEDLSSAARPLSSPLPPPSRERDEGEREPPPGMSFDDVEEEDQTMITPSHLAEELLARALEGAKTERPPPAPEPSEPPTTRQPLSELLKAEFEDIRPSAAQSLPASEPPLAETGRISSDPAPANDLNEAGANEETLVVSRKPEKPKKRSGLVGAIAALAAVFGLVSYAAMRARPGESEPAPAPVAIAPAAEPAPVEPEPTPPSELKPSENALVPLAPSGAEATPEPDKAAADEAPTPSAAAPAVAPSEPAAKAAAPAEPAPSEPAAPAVAAPSKPAAPAAAAPAAPAAQPAKAATPVPQPAGTTGSAQQPAAAEGATDPTAANEDAPTGSEFDELLKKGQRLLTQRDAAGARPVLEQALALQPDNPHVRASLGQTLLKLGELPAALVHAQTAVKLRPKRGHYSVIVGNVLAAMGRADEALAAFQRAYELDPNDAEAKRKAGF